MPRGSSRLLKRTDHLDLPRRRSVMGQSRHFDLGLAPSGLTRSTDIVRLPRHVGLVPRREVAALQARCAGARAEMPVAS